MKTILRGHPRLVLFLAVAALILVNSGVCLGGAPPTPTPTPTPNFLVQKASAGSANDQTTVSARFTNTPQQSHLLVAIVGVKAGDTITGVSSGGNAWATVFNEPGTTNPQRPGQAIFWRTAYIDEATTVTATTSQSTIGLQIFEYGISNPIIAGSNHNSGPGGVPANTGEVVPFTTQTGILVAGITINTADHIDGVTNGFTEEFDFVSGSAGGRQTFGSADRNNGPAGTNNTTFAHGNNSWRAQIVNFVCMFSSTCE